MNYRNRKLLDLCHGARCMLEIPDVCIGGTSPDAPSVPVHANWQIYGRGESFKSHDLYTVPGCPACHAEIDSGTWLTREQRHEYWLRAWIRWQYVLWSQQKVRVA